MSSSCSLSSNSRDWRKSGLFKSLVVLPMAVVAIGCASQTESPTAEPGPTLESSSEESTDEAGSELPGTDPLGVSTGTVLTVDGVEIAYDVRGQGDTTLVFVHCWTCDRSYWQEQLDTFAEDYRVVSLDLAGHGLSGTNREDWTVAAHAADVEAVLEELELHNVIMVGHSMGGSVSVVAAGQMPERVIGIACVDTLHDADAEFDPAFADQIATQMEADFMAVRSEMLGQMFLPDSGGEVEAWVVQRGETAYAPAEFDLLQDFATFDLGAAMSEVDVPIRCVNANALPPMIPETAVDTNQQYADFDAVIMDGVGHFLQLEDPEAFNVLLAETIAEIEG
ncbi:MAG: alpha/beta hydrolase [Cyanobacteria bacterium P01_E01_bin.45]